MIYRKNTKELLAESILELSQKKSVGKITIKEITENCGMTSPTFYNHFKDKYDLIAWIYIYQTEEIVEAYILEHISWKQTLYEVLLLIKSNSSFYRNAVQNTSGQNSFVFAVRGYSTQAMLRMLEKKKGSVLTEEEIFQLKFYAAGWIDLMTEWLNDQMSFDEEELAQLLFSAVPVLLQKYIQ